MLALGIVELLAGVGTAGAQRTRGTFTIGPQVGQPAGLTGKLYRSSRTAYAGLLTTDGDDFARLSLHRLRERPLPDSLLHLYLGPGLLVGGRQLDDAPVLQVGASVQVGLNFYAERFEVFVLTTPTVRFLPDVTPTLGGSVGLRYTFGWP